MTYQDLVDFLENRMRMSQIYQPLLIRALVDAGGAATLRQLAQAFLVQDESQLLFYEKRIKDMPLRILKKHGVVTSQGPLVSLLTSELTYQQRATIRQLCEQKMQAFIAQRGLEIWDYRLLESSPIPKDMRFRVLQESGGRCSLCGKTSKESPLEVDHIIPRSRGGSNDYENLQVLCKECNGAKSNQDLTDFRPTGTTSHAGCPFCFEQLQGRVIEELELCVAIKDNHPVTDGHMLILPKRHTPDYFSLTGREKNDVDALIRVLRKRIAEQDRRVTGFNIGINNGFDAGQTIFHAHIHLIPRRKGDCSDPRGGVRGVIPGKMGY